MCASWGEADRLLGEGKSVADVCRQLQVSEQTYFRWRSQFGGLKATTPSGSRSLSGFRPAYHDARAEGWAVNHKKIQRLWRDEGLRVPQRRRRKRLGTSTTPVPPVADAPNTVWAV